MVYDLHCHSNCSDGELAVNDLLALAEEKKVSVLSITDHDSVAAYHQKTFGQITLDQKTGKKPHKNANFKNNKLTVIPGVEFSTQWNHIGIHVLGLNIDPYSDAMEEGAALQQDAREKRAHIIAEKLEKAGLKDCYQGAKKFSGIAAVSRPHFAQYMVESGFVKNHQQAFKKYLGAGKIGDIKQGWASLEKVIEWIRDAGGVAVLAHPHKYKLTRTKLIALVDGFVQCGGEGLEILSGAEDKNMTAELVKLSQQKKLLASMGSDFHHRESSWNRLGMHPRLPAACRPVWERF